MSFSIKDFYLYNTFLQSGKYRTLKGDGGPELFLEMVNHIKNLKNEKLFEQIKNEIEVWIRIGNEDYMVMGANLVAELSLYEYIDVLKEKRIEIIKRGGGPYRMVATDFLENVLKRLGVIF